MQIPSPLTPDSAQAADIAHLFYIVLIIAIVIFAVVGGLVFTSVIRNRYHEGDPLPRQDFGNNKLEIIWTVIPGLILVGIFAATVRTMHNVDPHPISQKPDIDIVAHQWWWEVHYPDSGVVTANEIHIPTGKNVLLRVSSADVAHGFWVPRLGRKIDAIPNHPNESWISADNVGTYLGACSEFCGNDHAWMRFRVIAQPEKDFEAWLKAQGKTQNEPETDIAKEGAKIFQTRTCQNCHAIEGTAAKARIGPDLTHVASRARIAAGRLENTPENMSKWIADPQKYKPGCDMPDLQLSKHEIKALVAYLEGLN